MKKLLTIFILLPAWLEAQTIYLRMFDGVDSFRAWSWNNFKTGTPGKRDTTRALIDYFGNRTSVQVAFSEQGTFFDNGAPYFKGQVWPTDTLLRKGVYYSGAESIGLIGLDDSSLYTISFLGSRNRLDSQQTTYVSGGKTLKLVTDTNSTRWAVFSSMAPTKGRIIVTLSPVKLYEYVNVIVLVGVPKHPAIKARISIDSAVITSPNSYVVMIDSSTGPVVTEQWVQLGGPSQAIFTSLLSPFNKTWASGLFPGIYRFAMFVSDSVGNMASDSVTVKVNAFICPRPPPCPVCPVCPPPRTVVGMTMKLVSGVPILVFTYSDGNP